MLLKSDQETHSLSKAFQLYFASSPSEQRYQGLLQISTLVISEDFLRQIQIQRQKKDKDKDHLEHMQGGGGTVERGGLTTVVPPIRQRHLKNISKQRHQKGWIKGSKHV